jgi:hypothetical protein
MADDVEVILTITHYDSSETVIHFHLEGPGPASWKKHPTEGIIIKFQDTESEAIKGTRWVIPWLSIKYYHIEIV